MSPVNLSWRDVYDLVNNQTQNILTTMEDGFERVEKVTAGHERRLAAIEARRLVDDAAQEAKSVVATANRRNLDRLMVGTKGTVLLLLAVAGFFLQLASRVNIF